MKELIIGCGQNTKQKILANGENRNYQNPVTLDINADHKPDIVYDLEKLPYPFEDNEFDEIHAYEVLEHTGQQGDYKFFFAQFAEFWRILKPGGLLMATVPHYKSMWAYGDPSHTRVINQGSLVFLSQKQYEMQVGKTAISDFRYIYQADLEVAFSQETEHQFYFILKAIK